MDKIQNLQEITTELIGNLQNLQSLAIRVSLLGHRITKMTGDLDNFDNVSATAITLSSENMVPIFSTLPEKDRPLSGPENPLSDRPSNIIPFPGHDRFSTQNTTGNLIAVRQKNTFEPFLAKPGMPLPPDIPDYRPLLQRDGLILLSWDMHITEAGNRYTAYWVTSTGILRFYASKPYSSVDFPLARPDHKSYAAEDGIEFYGQTPPVYMVHVAPDLFICNPKHKELRKEHIKTLLSLGINVDFNYKYLLKTEKNRKLRSRRSVNENHNQAGA